MKKVLLSTFFIVIPFLGQSESYAQCDCLFGRNASENGGRTSRYRTAYEEFVYSEVVFIGEVLEIKRVENGATSKSTDHYDLEIAFRVKSSWKKKIDEYTVIRNSVWSCLIGFQKGDEYLVYASVDKNLLRTEFCSRTKLLRKATKELKEFKEKGQKPIETNKDSPPKSESEA